MDSVRIGVLANRGQEESLRKWNPTADYLSARIAGCHFEIVPLNFNEFGEVARQQKVDFLICNPGLFVEMEANHGAASLATLKTKAADGYYSVYGGAIFARSDSAIQTLRDLKGRRFMAVNRDSYGGWLCALRELQRSGIDPGKDLKSLSFCGTQDAVVQAVLSGKADAGTCRSGLIEQLAAKNELKMQELRVILANGNENWQQTGSFPFLTSTRLYPEWAFAKLKKADPDLATKIAIALLSMNATDHAAVAAGCGGWTYPLNYQAVHDLMRELKIGLYKDTDRIELRAVILRYWPTLAAALLTFIVLAGGFVAVSWLYRQLAEAKTNLDAELELRKTAELEKEKLIAELKNALSQVKTLSGIIPICAGCKQIRDDKGFWNQVEAYIQQHSPAKFSHSLCPDCTVKYFPNVKQSDEPQ